MVFLTCIIWIINVSFFVKGHVSAISTPETQLSAPKVKTLISSPSPSPQITINKPTGQALLKTQKFVYQTFNNCGPATLSMLLSFYGIEVSQQEIADDLRPFQQVKGIGDDKSVTLDELAGFAKKKNLETYKRPGGDMEKLKLFLENNIPILTITWLNLDGGFGHYRIIKGYDDKLNQIREDDSIFGLDQKLSYSEFLNLWQYFNYQYLIVVPPEKKDLVEAILRDENNITASYKLALSKAQNEYVQNPSNVLPLFNESTNFYYLGDFENSVKSFEQSQKNLHFRMTWYQLEPLLSYQKVKKYDKAFSLIDSIFKSGDIAFSELYRIRGEIYLDQGKIDEAKKEFQLAIYYNKNFIPAKETLSKL